MKAATALLLGLLAFTSFAKAQDNTQRFPVNDPKRVGSGSLLGTVSRILAIDLSSQPQSTVDLLNSTFEKIGSSHNDEPHEAIYNFITAWDTMLSAELQLTTMRNIADRGPENIRAAFNPDNASMIQHFPDGSSAQMPTGFALVSSIRIAQASDKVLRSEASPISLASTVEVTANANCDVATGLFSVTSEGPYSELLANNHVVYLAVATKDELQLHYNNQRYGTLLVNSSSNNMSLSIPDQPGIVLKLKRTETALGGIRVDTENCRIELTPAS